MAVRSWHRTSALGRDLPVVCVHSYIVCQIKPKRLQIKLTALVEEVARQLVSEDAQGNAWLSRALSSSGESMR